MSEPKTKPTGASVDAFIEAVEHQGRREDARVVLEMLRGVTGREPEMWGPSIVGFGRYRYTDAKGKPQEWPMVGFSPRKANLVLYVLQGAESRADLLQRLGKHKTGNACLYLNRLSDVDQDVLRELCVWSVERTREKYETS